MDGKIRRADRGVGAVRRGQGRNVLQRKDRRDRRQVRQERRAGNIALGIAARHSGHPQVGELSADDMAAMAALDKKQSSFFSHTDPTMVEWFAQMVEERKHNNDCKKEKNNW